MAFIPPKTDWTAADGVSLVDLNRIEGNILELYNTSQVRGAVSIYVSPTGSDDTGMGTSASPYRTIAKAVDSLPYVIGDHSVTLNIAAGTYNENVLIAGFTGMLTINTTY